MFRPAESAPAPTIAPTTPTAAGLEPAAYDANPYGKIRPKFIGGIALMGGRIIEGPWFGGTQTDPTLTAIYYLAEAANPGGTRTITELYIRGQLAAFDGSGNLTDAKFAGASVEFKTGTSPQTPCLQSVERYGANAIGYTRGILIAIKNLPLRPLAGMVPLISGKIEDSSFGTPSDGVDYSDLLSVILRDARYRDAEFSVDVTRTYPGMILASKSDLISFLQNERKIIVHMNVGFTDKVRITEPTTFQIDAEITNSNAVRGSLAFSKTDTTSAVRKIKSTYIDKDRDYQMNVVTATEDVFPYPSTSAVQEETVERPVISTAAQETSDAHIALYERLAVRSQMRATLLTSLFGTEVGDGSRYADHDVINLAARVMETQHDYEKWQVQITAGEVLNCGVEDPTDPYFGDVVLLVHGTGAPGSTSFTDSSSFAHAITTMGNAQVALTAGWGSGAASFDGTGDGLRTGNGTALWTAPLSPTNTSPYTIECWAYFNSINRTQVLIAIDTGVGGQLFRLQQNGDDELQYSFDGSLSQQLNTTGADITPATPVFIVVDKDSTGTMRIYVTNSVNGAVTMRAKDTPADSVLLNIVDPISIGSRGLSGSSFDGLIWDARITRGISRYGDVYGDASFSPPTRQFPDE